MTPVLETVTPSVRARGAQARAAIYGFLSRLYRNEPDHLLVDHLRNPDVLRHLVNAGLDLNGEEWLESSAEHVAEVLADDYTRLFLVPGNRIVLNESAHRQEDGSLMGHWTAQVRRLIDSLGFSINNEWSILPDHISIELELMQRLAYAEALFWETDSSASGLESRERQRTFVRDHLAVWVPGLCEAIETRAKTAFYRALARLTRLFILSEIRQLGCH